MVKYIKEEEVIEEKTYDKLEDEGLTSYRSIPKAELHMLNIKEEKELIMGLLPIKELLYEIRRLKNYNTYVSLKNKTKQNRME